MKFIEKVELALKKLAADDDLRPALKYLFNSGEYLVVTNGHLLAELELKRFTKKIRELGTDKWREEFPDWQENLPTWPPREQFSQMHMDRIWTPPYLFEMGIDEDGDRTTDCEVFEINDLHVVNPEYLNDIYALLKLLGGALVYIYQPNDPRKPILFGCDNPGLKIYLMPIEKRDWMDYLVINSTEFRRKNEPEKT